MTGIELFRQFKGCGVGAQKLAQMRGWLQDNKAASGEDLYHGLVLMASDPYKRVGDVAEGTLLKAAAILAGRDPHERIRIRPSEWDEDIDGLWIPGTTLSDRVAGAQPMAHNPSALPTPITTSAPLVDGMSTPPAGQSGPNPNIVHQVLTPTAAGAHAPDLGPKTINRPATAPLKK